MPIKSSKLEPLVITLVPTVGEHTERVLTELLSYSPSNIERLEQNAL